MRRGREPERSGGAAADREDADSDDQDSLQRASALSFALYARFASW